MKKILVILTIITIMGCEPFDDRLTIINKTDETIIIGDRLWLSDASIYINNKVPVDNFEFYENEIKPRSSLKMSKKGNWESSFINNDTMVILIFNKEAILQKRLKEPSKNYDIEQMIYVSKDYIEKNNWKIVIDSNTNAKIIKL